MLNVYDKYERPDELKEYKEKYVFLVAYHKLTKQPNTLTEEEKDILSNHRGLISKNTTASYKYAASVIKGRFPEGEPAIMKDLSTSYKYAEDVLDGRWAE